jgi:hypothetical protein
MLGGLCAEEGGEDAFSILGRDTRALVVYGQFQLAVVGDPRRDTERCAWRRVLDRVLQQVREYPFHLTCIHSN